MDTENQTIPTEVLLELNADPRRRRIVRHLVESDGKTAHVDDLVDGLADERRSTHRRDEDRLRAVLHHVHLPKLAAANVVDYDARTSTVRYYPTPELEELVRFVAEELR